MAHDVPITKADLDRLREELRSDVGELEQRLTDRMDAMKTEIIDQFGVIAEQIRHDLVGAHKDKIEVLVHHDVSHEQRIRRLERAVGIVA